MTENKAYKIYDPDILPKVSGHLVSLDTETTGLKWYRPDVHVIGVSVECPTANIHGFIHCQDERRREWVYDEIQKIEPKTQVIMHNAKFDIPLLGSLGLVIDDYEDTMLIAYSAGILEKSLEALSESILHRDCPSVTDQWRKPNQGNIAIDHVRMGEICIIHACNTFALEQKLPKTELYKTIDKPSIKLLMEMEQWGVLIDQYRLTLVEQQVISRALPMERELLGELEIENLASNPQVAEALQKKGIIGTRKTGSDKNSVSEESLKPLDLPLTNSILKWRSLMKTLTTYVPAFRRIDHTGRIHTRFGFTNTGRWSSSAPNLQNITRDSKFEDKEETHESI